VEADEMPATALSLRRTVHFQLADMKLTEGKTA